MCKTLWSKDYSYASCETTNKSVYCKQLQFCRPLTWLYILCLSKLWSQSKGKTMLAVINQSLPPLLCSKVLKMNKEQVLSLVLFLMLVAPILVFFSLPHLVFNPAFLSPSNSLLQLLSDRFIHWSRSNIKVTSELELHQDSPPPLPPTLLPPICFNPITSSSCAVSANRLQGGNPS